MAVKRTNTYAFIVWQESAPKSWRDIISGLRIPCAISPLHDRDTYDESDHAKNPDVVVGSPKKPHWHVMLFFESLKSAQQILDLVAPLGILYVEPVSSRRAYCRYLCHLDDQPFKALYSLEDVILLAGAESYYDATRELTGVISRQLRNDIQGIIRENSFTEYAEIIDYLDDNGMVEHSDWAASHTMHLNSYLTSRRGIAKARYEALEAERRAYRITGEDPDE